MRKEIGGVLTGTWEVSMINAPAEKPLTCCYGLFCPALFAYQQRGQLLDLTGEPYVCCAGMCCCLTQPCQDRNPWLCLEACCCTNYAVIANRFMLQTRFNIMNDPCDTKLMQIAVCIGCLAIILSIFTPGTATNTASSSEVSTSCDQLLECIMTAVCACFLTQQDIQINKIKESGNRFQQIDPSIFVALPPQQQSMINGFAQVQPSAPHGPVEIELPAKCKELPPMFPDTNGMSANQALPRNDVQVPQSSASTSPGMAQPIVVVPYASKSASGKTDAEPDAKVFES